MKQKKIRYICIFLAALATACILLLPYYRQIRNELLLRLLPPSGYMAVLEKEYIESLSEEWEQTAENASRQLSGYSINSVSLEAEVNRLVAELLGDNLPFSSASLDVSWDSIDTVSMLHAVFHADDNTSSLLELTNDKEAKTITAACPMLSDAAVVFSTSSKDPSARFIRYVCDILDAFFQSVSSAVIQSPYDYLLPFLDVLGETEIIRDYPLVSGDETVLATRMHTSLSVETALLTASKQLEKMQAAQVVPDPVLACYDFCTFLLGELASRYPVDISVTAYADAKGNILGHEFGLFGGGKLLFSTSGLLSADPTSNRSGNITVTLGNPDSEHRSETVIPLEIEQFGFDPATGYPSGKISFTLPDQPMLYFQVSFIQRDHLPAVRLFVRAAGITAASITIFPAKKTPDLNPVPPSYSKIYPLSEWYNESGKPGFRPFLEWFYREFLMRFFL